MKYIVMLLLLSYTISAQAQKGTTTFSVSYGDGKGQIRPLLAKAEMTGSYSEGTIRTFDFGLSGMLSDYAALEIGVSILNHRYQYTKYDFPNGLQSPVNKSVNTLVFPLKLKFDILKYFFVSGGILLNADLGVHDEIDIGFGIGAGVQYYFKNKYGFFIYPQTNVHTIAIGLSENHVAFGLAYRIPYLKQPHRN
jgi:hypothetical protein